MTNNIRVDMDKSWALLKELILHNTSPGAATQATHIKGLAFHRFESNEDPKPRFYEPVIIVVAQGKKLVRIGAQEYHYGEKLCFISGVDMPVSSCVLQADSQNPYLSVSLHLNPGLLATLAAKAPPPVAPSGVSRGAVIQNVEPDLLDSLLRLVELASKAEHIPVMEDLLLQEIHFRLLASPFGGILRTLNTFGSQGNQITRAIAWLKDHFKEPLLVEDLAALSNMAPSTFHKYFKEITTISPLQFQKRLRLSEAQRIMLSDGHDVTQAAMSVGYESATQFTREYKRLFGEPPHRNVRQIKNAASGEAWGTA